MTPPTVLTIAIFDKPGAPCQRSIANVNARRMRGSSNGFLSWLGVTALATFQSLSCTVILSPSALTKLVACCGRHAAEFDRRAVGADRLNPNRLLVGINADEAVEIGPPLMVIIGVLHTLDRLADLIVDEFERARAENVLLVPARVLVRCLPSSPR